MAKQYRVRKSTGELEVFDPQKLIDSLSRSGATIFLANDILDKVEADLRDEMPTSEIYKKAYSILNKRKKETAVRYSLRRSLLSLGPTGFPFEEFIAGIYRAKGYVTETGLVFSGKCVDHEIDIIAQKGDDLIFTEAKFHNQLGVKSDTKTALYVKARFDDLYDQTFSFNGKKQKMTRGVLITNTKFTENAKKYARCTNTYDMIGWEYPEKGNLYDLIEETGLHPMTCVNELSRYHKEELIKHGVIDCKDLKNRVDLMEQIGVSQKKIEAILKNIDVICSPEHDEA